LTAELVLAMTRRDAADAKVVALSHDGDIGIANVVTNDGDERLIDALEFRWTESIGWQIEALGNRSDFTAAIGQAPHLRGGMLRAEVRERSFSVPVSEGGWYGLVAIVEDGRDPASRVQFPDFE